MMRSPLKTAVSHQLSAISGQQTAISYQPSVVSRQPLAPKAKAEC